MFYFAVNWETQKLVYSNFNKTANTLNIPLQKAACFEELFTAVKTLACLILLPPEMKFGKRCQVKISTSTGLFVKI